MKETENFSWINLYIGDFIESMRSRLQGTPFNVINFTFRRMHREPKTFQIWFIFVIEFSTAYAIHFHFTGKKNAGCLSDLVVIFLFFSSRLRTTCKGKLL